MIFLRGVCKECQKRLALQSYVPARLGLSLQEYIAKEIFVNLCSE